MILREDQHFHVVSGEFETFWKDTPKECLLGIEKNPNFVIGLLKAYIPCLKGKLRQAMKFIAGLNYLGEYPWALYKVLCGVPYADTEKEGYRSCWLQGQLEVSRSTRLKTVKKWQRDCKVTHFTCIDYNCSNCYPALIICCTTQRLGDVLNNVSLLRPKSLPDEFLSKGLTCWHSIQHWNSSSATCKVSGGKVNDQSVPSLTHFQLWCVDIKSLYCRRFKSRDGGERVSKW